jgi:hypothetical protein
MPLRIVYRKGSACPVVYRDVCGLMIDDAKYGNYY